MGNTASSASSAAAAAGHDFRGLDQGVRRDAREGSAPLLAAASVARDARRATATHATASTTGRALSLLNGLLSTPTASPSSDLPVDDSISDDGDDDTQTSGTEAISDHDDDGDDSGAGATKTHEAASPSSVDGSTAATAVATSAGTPIGLKRATVPMELKELGRRVMRGAEYSDDVVKKLVDRTAVRVFVSCTSADTQWERNALAKDVWPFLHRFCKILGLEFEVIDLHFNDFDANAHRNKEHERSLSLLKRCLETSAGPSFISFLGDKYGETLLPTTILATDFEVMSAHLKAHNRSRDVNDLLEMWYTLDTNAEPPVYCLRPVTDIFPAFASDDLEVRFEAIGVWEDVRARLSALLKAGSVALTPESESRKAYFRSLTEEELSLAYPHRTGNEPDRFYCFHRTLLDIKRKYNENASTASNYIDLINRSSPDKEAATELARLRAKTKANRFYAIPWRTDPLGLNPDADRSHGNYLRSFCDDVSRIVAESVLRHYTAKVFTRDWDPLLSEVVAHVCVIKEQCSDFVGRGEIVDSISDFLSDPEASVCIIYGASGVGKTALIARAVTRANELNANATIVTRFVGSTADSSDSRSIMRSICSQLARTYGMIELRKRIVETINDATVEMDSDGDDGLRSLLGDLENWPPTSYEGLRFALPIVLSLATDERPIVLVLDALDELSSSDDARDLQWLPLELPPNVKILLSSSPSTTTNQTLQILTATYPAEVPEFRHIEVPSLLDSDVDLIIAKLQARDSRRLAETQANVLRRRALHSRMPLYVKASWDLIASRWTSSDDAESSIDAETVVGLIEGVLETVERKLGIVFVSRAVGFIAAARRGLCRGELEDLLSCDDDVLREVFKNFEPAIRRIPTILVIRLLEELKGMIVERQVDGVYGFFWAHKQFLRVAEDRYLDPERALQTHSALADYWSGRWASTPKPYIPVVASTSPTSNSTPALAAKLRYIIDQSLLIAGKPNTRRLASLPWHQLESGASGFQDVSRTLQDLSHLGAALDADLLWDVLASFRATLARDSAEGLLLPPLVDYYRFLLASAAILSADPRQLIPVAVNLYQGSVVAEDARKWVASNAPNMCWAEWANRPLARGEPIATLKAGDSEGAVMVTGRDTHGERVALVGIRTTDGARVVTVFDTAEIRAAATGGGSARLMARGIVPDGEDAEDEGHPLICAFSRDGEDIVIASRSVVVINAHDLSLRGRGVDPELPDGDVITAVAWTKDDGCLVTASDGSEPGRIALWDAESFTLLRVIKAQYPRQPVSSAYRTMGFWDEYRSLFILLDVDELAADAESGLFLQYIPSVPHCDPPPDGPSRFALAHRAPLVLIAADDGRGYVLIDFKAKRPVARLSCDVDTVRFVALSHDGSRVAVVPHEGRVITIYELQSPDGTPNNISFEFLGTVLGVGNGSDAATLTPCLFSRSGNTVLTDGPGMSVKVWDMQELGDHSTLRFRSVLPNLPQGLAPISSSGVSHPVGWAVTEDALDVSLAVASGRTKVRSYRVSAGTNRRRPRRADANVRDVILGVASHPSRPLLAAVTDSGNVTIISADRLPDLPATILGTLWSTAFGKSAGGKDGDNGQSTTAGRLTSFNVREAGAQAGTTCITFIPVTSSGSSGQLNTPTVTSPQPSNSSDTLVFATGHDDGSVSVWEWSPLTDPLDLSPRVTLRLNAGRITSIVSANVCLPNTRRLAVTVDDSAVLVWDGVNDDTESATVLIPPSEDLIAPTRTRWNLDRPCAVAFARTRDLLLATGSAMGSITIWNLERGVKRTLMTPSGLGPRPAPVMCIGWASDDAAMVSVLEDKRVCVHSTVSGDLVWVHSLWMVTPAISVASLAPGARHVSIVDHDGELTVVHLNGEWPAASAPGSGSVLSAAQRAISGAPVSASVSFGEHPATKMWMGDLFPKPADAEFLTASEWDPSISVRLVRRRIERHTRVATGWEKSTGSGLRGHVALIRMTDGLPRGTYEVLCEVEIPESAAAVESSEESMSPGASRKATCTPLKFVCGVEDEIGDIDDSLAVMRSEDPELQGLKGFSRLFPVEEQMSLAGKGMTMLHLGYVKAACKLNFCCVDLKRIPGPGEPFEFGRVHFIPVDPRLYRSEFEPPVELADAFTKLSESFFAFEESHRRRHEGIAMKQMQQEQLVDEPRELRSDGSPTAADEKTSSTWVSHGEDEASAAVAAKRQTRAMSVFQPLAGVVGGILGVVGTTTGTTPSPAPRAPPSLADIEKEMELARIKARLEAKILEEEEEETLAIEETKERNRLAREVAQRRATLVPNSARPNQMLQDDINGPPSDLEADEIAHMRAVQEAEETLRRLETTLSLSVGGSGEVASPTAESAPADHALPEVPVVTSEKISVPAPVDSELIAFSPVAAIESLEPGVEKEIAAESPLLDDPLSPSPHVVHEEPTALLEVKGEPIIQDQRAIIAVDESSESVSEAVSKTMSEEYVLLERESRDHAKESPEVGMLESAETAEEVGIDA